MRLIDLREEKNFVRQYVELRNAHLGLILSSAVTPEETVLWLDSGKAVVRGLVEKEALLGAVVLYLERQGEIAFFVDKKNKGTGTRLLTIIENVAAGLGLHAVWAWVRQDNTIACHVFEKNGFIPADKTSRDFKGQSIKGIIFRKALQAHPPTARTTIKHTQEKYDLRPEAKEFPMMCVLSFVYICNARCLNCPYTNSDIRSTYEDTPIMGEDTFKIIADQCGQHQAWVRISGGGEPMLHPKATELMEYAKKANAKVGLITNGSLFTEENSRRLLEAGVDMIEFSVDAGDAATYERVRKGLKWDIVVSSVKRMVAMRTRLGASTKIIASVVNQTGVDVAGAIKFWEPLVDNIQKRKYLTWGINDPAKSADAEPYLAPENHIPCPFIFERLNIDSRGKVMVCGYDIRALTDLGNIREKPIKEIWKSPEFEYYRSMHLSKRGQEIPLCSKCPDWKYRSWQHNYWKVVANAEKKKKERFGQLHMQDIEGCMYDEQPDAE